METIEYAEFTYTNRAGELFVVLIDESDAHWLEDYSWSLSFSKTQRGRYVIFRAGSLRNKKLHRILMGEPERLQVDHINGNSLDNRRSNLRVTTGAVNTHNRNNGPKIRKYGQIQERHQKFGATCTMRTEHNGKGLWLGTYSTYEEADEVLLWHYKVEHGL